MIELFIPNSTIVFVFMILAVFWRENDVTVHKANFRFHAMVHGMVPEYMILKELAEIK